MIIHSSALDLRHPLRDPDMVAVEDYRHHILRKLQMYDALLPVHRHFVNHRLLTRVEISRLQCIQNAISGKFGCIDHRVGAALIALIAVCIVTCYRRNQPIVIRSPDIEPCRGIRSLPVKGKIRYRIVNFRCRDSVQILDALRIHHGPGRMCQNGNSSVSTDCIHDLLRSRMLLLPAVLRRIRGHADSQNMVGQHIPEGSRIRAAGVPFHTGKNQHLSGINKILPRGISRPVIRISALARSNRYRRSSVIGQGNKIISVPAINFCRLLRTYVSVRAGCMHMQVPLEPVSPVFKD